MREPEDDDPFRSGTPSLDEWNGLWRSSPTDPVVGEQEYHEVWEQFQDHLGTLGCTCQGPALEFYFRGDNYGDRTQYLEVAKPESLNVKLVRNLQELLKRPRYRQWRILIVTYIGDAAAPVVYPNVVRLGKEYGNDLHQALDRIVRKMRERMAGK